jgi:hypothetical protein
LKFPLSVNEPVSVTVGKVQAVLFTVKLMLLVPSDPSLLTVRFVTNANASVPELFKVAFQVPLILPATFEFDPHPESTRIAASDMTAAVLFIKKFLHFLGIPEAAPSRMPASGGKGVRLRNGFRPKERNPGLTKRLLCNSNRGRRYYERFAHNNFHQRRSIENSD